MKEKHSRVIPFIFIVFSMFCIFSFACEQGDNNPLETGSIAFSIVWNGGPILSSEFFRAAVNCDAIEVATVRAEIYDAADNLAGSGGPWDCENHSGTILEVHPGTNYTVIILGVDDSGDVLYQGEVSGITVEAGQTNHVGEIVLEFLTLFWGQGKWGRTNWGD